MNRENVEILQNVNPQRNMGKCVNIPSCFSFVPLSFPVLPPVKSIICRRQLICRGNFRLFTSYDFCAAFGSAVFEFL